MILNNLEELMKIHNVNISKLSEETLISRNTISSIVNKGNELTSFQTRTLERLSSYFGIDIGEILIHIDDSITVDSLYSLTADQELLKKENIDGSNLYDGTIIFNLKNEFEKKYEISASISCLTNVHFNHNKEVKKKTVFDIEFDNRLNSYKYDIDMISSKLIENLFTRTIFVGKELVPWIYSLWGAAYSDINMIENPFYTVNLIFKSDNLNKENYYKQFTFYYNTEKKNITIINIDETTI